MFETEVAISSVGLEGDGRGKSFRRGDSSSCVTFDDVVLDVPSGSSRVKTFLSFVTVSAPNLLEESTSLGRLGAASVDGHRETRVEGACNISCRTWRPRLFRSSVREPCRVEVAVSMHRAASRCG